MSDLAITFPLLLSLLISLLLQRKRKEEKGRRNGNKVDNTKLRSKPMNFGVPDDADKEYMINNIRF